MEHGSTNASKTAQAAEKLATDETRMKHGYDAEDRFVHFLVFIRSTNV
jgi:hypothetical protein